MVHGSDIASCGVDDKLSDWTDEESLRSSAESLLCDELMWQSDDDTGCASPPR